MLGYDPERSEALLAMRSFQYAEMDEVLARSDIVSLHCPPSPNGQPVMSRSRIAGIKQGSYDVFAKLAELQVIADACREVRRLLGA